MLDINNCFTHASGDLTQAVSGNADATNVIDLIGADSPSTINLNGGGKPVWLIVKVTTAATAGTIVVDLVTDEAAALDTSPIVLLRHTFADEDLILAAAADGCIINIPIPAVKYKRYLGLEFTITNTTATFCAYLSDAPEPHMTPRTAAGT